MTNRLSWDNNPVRKPWSAALLTAVASERANLENGQPENYIAGYTALAPDMKNVFWAELIIDIANYESSWNPNSVFHEPAPLNEDSVGLLQLSYKDADNYTFPVVLNPALNSLEDPITNLRCGVVILAHWLTKDRVVAAGQGNASKGAARYWSVIRQGPTHHYAGILNRVKSAVNLV